MELRPFEGHRENPKPKVAKTEVSSTLYSVNISCDYREALFEVTLYDESIAAAGAKLRPKGLTWDFLGYITETPFVIEDIRGDKDFRKPASIGFKQSDEMPLGLKPGMAEPN